jgi:predicted nucleic acid-binding protein
MAIGLDVIWIDVHDQVADFAAGSFPYRHGGKGVGRSMATDDAVIAATALAQGASLATGHVADFADIGLELINPWDTP